MTAPRPEFISAYYQLRRRLTDAPPTPHNEIDEMLVTLMYEVRREAAEQLRADAGLREAEGQSVEARYGRELADLIDPDKEWR